MAKEQSIYLPKLQEDENGQEVYLEQGFSWLSMLSSLTEVFQTATVDHSVNAVAIETALQQLSPYIQSLTRKKGTAEIKRAAQNLVTRLTELTEKLGDQLDFDLDEDDALRLSYEIEAFILTVIAHPRQRALIESEVVSTITQMFPQSALLTYLTQDLPAITGQQDEVSRESVHGAPSNVTSNRGMNYRMPDWLK